MQAPQPAPEPRTWTLVDVLLIGVMYFVAVIVGVVLVALIARVLGYDAKILLVNPLVLVPVQALGYVFTFLCARVVITLKTQRGFIESIDWNYPGPERLPQLLLLGLLVALVAGVLASFLPNPPDPPIRKYFATRTLAILSMLFGLLVAPLAEEVFFRGLFYPALRRSLDDDRSRRILGMTLILLAVAFGIVALRGLGTSYALFAPILLAFGLLLMPLRYESAPLLDGERQTMIAIVLTSVFFAYIHGAQLANSWGPMVPILLVGLVITTIRVRLNSVAAGWLVHVGYNGTFFLIMWTTSSGFRNIV
jgi:hypothetical protein